MKILLTGSEGLLGSAILRANMEHEIVPCPHGELDLTGFEDVLAAFQRVKPDAVIHTAALVGGIGGNLMKSGGYFHGNTQINLNVLEAARRTGVRNVLAFMSTCIFPDQARYPLTIDQLHMGPPHPSNYGYAYSKRMLDIQARAYNEQWGTNFKILVPANMYGPNDNFNLTEGHVIPALVHRAYQARLKGTDFVAWGSGKPLREFIYAGDVARVCLELIDKELDEPLIVSNGRETSIEHLVGLILDSIGFAGRLIWDRDKPDGQLRKPSDVTPLGALFPGFRFTDLETGIQQTVDWFEQHYPNVRL